MLRNFLHFIRARKIVEAIAPNRSMDYEFRIKNEISSFRDVVNVSNLPEIHGYWATKYVLPLLSPFGFGNDVEFFHRYISKAANNCLGMGPISDKVATQTCRVIALGSGNCELEVTLIERLLAAGIRNVTIECTDLNPYMLDRGRALAAEKNVLDRLEFTQMDVNRWEPVGKYDVVIACHSLHHFLELDYLFDAIHGCLQENGYFLTHDMIGRNGHMRWPEALELVNALWEELPDSYKYNHLQRRVELKYDNFDCSKDGFEGIRAQDILPLLIERFEFELFVPFGNLIDIFVDRCFGFNFDCANSWDIDFIDRVQRMDEEAIEAGRITPTHMYAAMKISKPSERHFIKHLTPEFCVRKVK